MADSGAGGGAGAGGEVVAASLKGWVFVVNPASGSGSTGKRWPKMLQRFKDAAAKKSWSDIGAQGLLHARASARTRAPVLNVAVSLLQRTCRWS